jgi:hypothetical protein
MKHTLFLRSILRPGLEFMADVLGEDRMSTDTAEVLLLSIALQESACRWRRQQPGPARGFWQFERRGGFVEVREKATTKPKLELLLKELNLPTASDADEPALWDAFEDSELAQVCFARLLLWGDPQPLPLIGHAGDAWSVYLRNWRPGKPRLQEWPGNYQKALEATASRSTAPALKNSNINAAREALRQALTYLDAT